MRPPICEVCDDRFSPRDGALISFRSGWTADSPAQAEPALGPGSATGHPENQGWFCPEHMEDAEAMADWTLRRALDELRSPMRAPGAVQRRLFAEVSVSRAVDIEPRSPEGIRVAVVQARKALAPLFVEPLNNLGSSSPRHPLPAEPVYENAVDYRESVSVARAGADAMHVLTKSWYCSKHSVVASHGEMVVTVDDAIVLGVEFVASLEDSLACRRLVINEDPEFVGDPDVAAAIERMVNVFGVAQFDPVALAPDLVGVDLLGGRLGGSVTFESRTVEWDIAPTSVGRLDELLCDHLAPFMSALGYGEPAALPQLKATTNRRWNPMDGSKPPHCPFTDDTVSTGLVETPVGMVEVTVQLSQTHWNEGNVANASVSLLLRGPKYDEPFLLSAHAPSGRDVSVLRLRRPTSSSAIVAVAAVAKSLSPG